MFYWNVFNKVPIDAAYICSLSNTYSQLFYRQSASQNVLHDRWSERLWRVFRCVTFSKRVVIGLVFSYEFTGLAALFIVQKMLSHKAFFLLLVCYCFNFLKIKHQDEWNEKYKNAKYLDLKFDSCRTSETSVCIIKCIVCC